MTRPITAVALAALAAAPLAVTARAASAQVVVHDPAGYAQMLEDARTALDQLERLQAQLEQARALYDSLNDPSEAAGLARELLEAELGADLPDPQALAAAAQGNLDALSRLADRARALREAMSAYTPDAGAEADPDVRALMAAGDRAARDQALAEALLREAGDRLDSLGVLEAGVGSGGARATLDLQARLQAEQAQAQVAALRLQALAMAQSAEARAADQAQRERAAARRQARLALYARSAGD